MTTTPSEAPCDASVYDASVYCGDQMAANAIASRLSPFDCNALYPEVPMMKSTALKSMKSVLEAPETPFDSIEGAHQYVSLLAEALDEARIAVQRDADIAGRTTGTERRVAVLQVVAYKLNQLGEHLAATRRLLNDLRMLRRLLLGERGEPATESRDGA